jgi:hypothetical protein
MAVFRSWGARCSGHPGKGPGAVVRSALRGRPPDQRSIASGPGSGEPGVAAPISAINKVTRVQRCPAPLSRTRTSSGRRCGDKAAAACHYCHPGQAQPKRSSLDAASFPAREPAPRAACGSHQILQPLGPGFASLARDDNRVGVAARLRRLAFQPSETLWNRAGVPAFAAMTLKWGRPTLRRIVDTAAVGVAHTRQTGGPST